MLAFIEPKPSDGEISERRESQRFQPLREGSLRAAVRGAADSIEMAVIDISRGGLNLEGNPESAIPSGDRNSLACDVFTRDEAGNVQGISAGKIQVLRDYDGPRGKGIACRVAESSGSWAQTFGQ